MSRSFFPACAVLIACVGPVDLPEPRDAEGEDAGVEDAALEDAALEDAALDDSGDPCRGVECTAPPEPACADVITMRTYDAAGVCSDGGCTYAHIDVACPNGCEDGRCASGRWTAMATDGAPLPRTGHAAVWTGTELIVWGGAGSADGIGIATLDTGARYDPSTDTWAPTSVEGAPAPRMRFVFVWTGTELIVWGGDDWTSYFAAGGRYDPESDSWRPMATDGAPPPCSSCRAVWTGTEMIVWGGFAAGGRRTNVGGRYDPATDTWRSLSTVGAPTARYEHTAVWTGTEMIVWGGIGDGSPPFQASGGRYDPATDTWRPTSMAGAPAARNQHEALWTGAEMIVWGETGAGGRYDPVTDTWAAMAPTGLEVSVYEMHAATAAWTGARFVVLGYNVGGRAWDLASGTWSPLAGDVPERWLGHEGAWTGTELLVWGGQVAVIDDEGTYRNELTPQGYRYRP